MLLIRPSTAAVAQIKARLSAEMRALRGHNAAAVITRLNPIIRGWAAYYRGVVSSEIFASLDNHMWQLAYKWARHTPEKVETLDNLQILRPFQPVQAGPVGVRRPRHRPIPPEIRLDKNRQAPAGPPGRFPGRPGTRRLLGPQATQEPAPAGHDLAAHAPPAAREMPALRGHTPGRRPAATKPPRMGAVAPGNPDGNPPGRRPARGHAGQQYRLPPHPRFLPPPAHGQRQVGTSRSGGPTAPEPVRAGCG